MKQLAFFLLACFILLINAQTEQLASWRQEAQWVEAYRLKDSIIPAYFDLPLRIPPNLSANFGELRGDHFHSGLDFKTQGVINKPVYAVAPAYVSRISVRERGFGKALYLDHPNGYTSVYAHLESLSPKLDSLLRDRQYASESYVQNILFSPQELGVERGELIGYSGNTGSSGGPHLHFEIRHTATEEPVDPMLWYRDRIKDTRPPRIRALAVYALPGQGALLNRDNKQTAKELIPINQESPTNIDHALPLVWGRVALGIKAYDYTNGNHNLLGISRIRLLLNEKEIFHQEIVRFSFDESRYLNALVDYEEWVTKRSWIMKSYVEPFNDLDVYPSICNNGFIDIDQEQDYHFMYELQDISGNKTSLEFKLQGRRMAIPKEDSSRIYFYPEYNNRYSDKNIDLSFPPGAFYNKVPFEYEYISPPNLVFQKLQQIKTYSGWHKIHQQETPLHLPGKVSIKVIEDTLMNKNHYYLARIPDPSKTEYVAASYSKGFMEGDILQFGMYAVLSDKIPPKILAPQFEKNQNNHLIRIVVLDDESGIDSYECKINGHWALFEYDYKTNTLQADLKDPRLSLYPEDNMLQIYLRDKCGNENYKEWKFNTIKTE